MFRCFCLVWADSKAFVLLLRGLASSSMGAKWVSQLQCWRWKVLVTHMKFFQDDRVEVSNHSKWNWKPPLFFGGLYRYNVSDSKKGHGLMAWLFFVWEWDECQRPKTVKFKECWCFAVLASMTWYYLWMFQLGRNLSLMVKDGEMNQGAYWTPTVVCYEDVWGMSLYPVMYGIRNIVCITVHEIHVIWTKRCMCACSAHIKMDRWMHGTDRQIQRQIDVTTWLPDFLLDWLLVWLPMWLLFDFLFLCFAVLVVAIGWLVDWLIGGWVDWLSGWLSDRPMHTWKHRFFLHSRHRS